MNKIFKIFIFGLIIIFAVQKEGHMGDAILKEISIKDLVGMSDSIIVVKKDEPFKSEIKIDITPENEIRNEDKYPPYLKNEYNFIVEDILYAGIISIPFEDRVMPNIKKNDDIKVSDAEFECELEYYKRYHIEGVEVSPIFSFYESKDNNRNLETEDKKIIFLKTKDYKEYRYTVSGAIESISNIKKIKKLIKKLK